MSREFARFDVQVAQHLIFVAEGYGQLTLIPSSGTQLNGLVAIASGSLDADDDLTVAARQSTQMASSLLGATFATIIRASQEAGPEESESLLAGAVLVLNDYLRGEIKRRDGI